MPNTPMTVEEFIGKKTSATGATPTPAATSTPTPAKRPISVEEFVSKKRALPVAAGGAAADVPKEDTNIAAEFAKGLFSAPATIVARPLQLGAELLMPGDNTKEIDEFSSKYSGGLVAPVPQNFGDVKKDVGRGIQTVALGTGAPIAGGAAFGVGASLEQGNDLLSLDTAFQAALGGGIGKVAHIVGKPLLDASGKVIGVITPQILKDAALGGAKGIAQFAERNKLLGGIAAKPSAAIARGFQATDDAIMTGIKAGGTGLKNTAAQQFPGMNPVRHFTEKAEQDLLKPTTLNQPKYAKASAIYADAKKRGIDLDKTATQNRIFHDDLIGDGKFNTKEAEEALREAVYRDGNEIIRPALKDIEPGVRLVPIAEVRQAMLNRVDQIPSSKITPAERARMRKQVEAEYSDTGAAAKEHPNGYSLTNLHDARIAAGQNGKYVAGVSTPPAVIKAKLARQQAKVFEDLFDSAIPAEAGLAQIRREFQKSFMLADYLKALHGKAVPEGAAKKAVRLFGRAAAATVGGKIGGFPGAILGSQYGDMLFASFEALPNPLKKIVLSRLAAEKSPAFDVLRQYLGDVQAEKLLQKALPAPGQSSFTPQGATLFTTPGGVSTPLKGEAIDITAVEQGRARAPKTDRRLRSYLTKTQMAQDAQEPYVPGGQLPTIKAGRKPKPPRALTDIYID